jgi:hypothetical protein
MTPQEFAALSRADKIRAVVAWNLANKHLTFASRAAARACAEVFGAPINTVRGLFGAADRAEGWCDCCGGIMLKVEGQCLECGTIRNLDCEGCPTGYATTEEPMPLCPDCSTPEPDAKEIKPIRDRAADAAAGRAAARQPRPPKRKRRYYVDDDGLFQPVKAGEPLHICPTCGAQAFIHYELAAGFGIRNMGGVLRPQSLCRACRTNHARTRRKAQFDLVSDSVAQGAAPPRAMKQGELDEIARLAVVALRLGAATVDLTVKKDPKVAFVADTATTALYPLCPEGPLGLIVTHDHEGGTLRLRFDASALRDWAVSQGAKLIAEAQTGELSAYQNPPGLAGLLGGMR